MSGELVNTGTGEVVETSMTGLAINRDPAIVLAEATKAAKALQTVVAGKRKPVIFNGEQYLEFEDWQTVARFYGLTVKVVSTSPITCGDASGFEARAVVLDKIGNEVSAADSMCLNDEPNWSKKPLFQLRSMAQTRTCAKALRNVLAWVVVLAGYKPTPAEEMDGVTPRTTKPPTTTPQSTQKPKAGCILPRQAGAFYSAHHKAGKTDAQVKEYLATIGATCAAEIKTDDYDDAMLWAVAPLTHNDANDALENSFGEK